MGRSAERIRRIAGALLPRSRGWRVVIVVAAVLIVLALVDPVVGLVAGMVGLVRAIVEPLFASPGGRLLFLNVVLLVALIAAALALRQRIRALRAGLVLRRHLDGMAALLRDERDIARDQLRRVVRSPTPPEFEAAAAQARLGLARVALRDRDPEEALRVLAGIREQDLPTELARSLAQIRAESWRTHGEVLPEEIEEHVQRALQTWPDDARLLRVRRELRLEAGDREKAIAAQRQVVEHVAPRERGAERDRLLRMLVDSARHLLDGALQPAQRALAEAWIHEARALAPDDPEPGCLLGDLRLRDGDVLDALRTWGRTRSRAGLDRAAALLGAQPDCVSVREFLEACPLDGSLLLAARLYADRGQPDEAVRAARMAARRCGPTPPVVIAVADVLERCDRGQEAAALRSTALQRALGAPTVPAIENADPALPR